MERKRYKMVVMDMDYTLLNKDKEVSERNKAAIKKAKELGVIVVVATGRLYTSAKYYAELLDISTPVIASNGAIIKEKATNKVIYRSLLPEIAMKEMIHLTKQAGLYCHLYSEDTIYTEKLVNISLNYSKWNEQMAIKDKVKVEVVEDLYALLEQKDKNILKAVVIDSDKQKIENIRNQILKTGVVTVSQSLKDNIEVMSKEVSKGNAIKILAEIYDIAQQDIIAIGDNENDISMIEYAGLGIAMENAEASLKQAADYITGHYEADGVAEAIEKFIINA